MIQYIKEKRLISLILIFSLSIFAVGCGNSDNATDSSNNAKSQQEETSGIVATDYSHEGNWLKLPEENTYEIDVIYLYPTAYATQSEKDPDYCEIENEVFRKRATDIYQMQGTAFDTVGNMYAPFYRQIAVERIKDTSPEGTYAALSKEPAVDLFAALDYYFEHYNKGKPYILAAHSQGSNMLSIILAEYMKEHPKNYELMIAAYQLGYSLTTDYLESNPHVKSAQSADDIGVVVSWNVEGPKNSGQPNFVVAENSVCINPLNWKIDETLATVEENRGSLFLDGKGNASIGKGIADAAINLERGSVICKSVDPKIYAIPNVSLFGPESYHSQDYGFYYMNIRENAALRGKTYIENR